MPPGEPADLTGLSVRASSARAAQDHSALQNESSALSCSAPRINSTGTVCPGWMPASSLSRCTELLRAWEAKLSMTSPASRPARSATPPGVTRPTNAPRVAWQRPFAAISAASATAAPSRGRRAWASMASSRWRSKPTTVCPPMVVTGTPCCPDRRTISAAAALSRETSNSRKGTD